MKYFFLNYPKKLLICYLSFFMFFSLNTFGQTKEKTTKTGRVEKKKSFLFNEEKLIKHAQYYDNGKIKSESVYDTSKNNLGVQIFYDSNGVLTRRFYVMEIVQIPYSVYKDTVDTEDKLVDVVSGMEFNYHKNGQLNSKGMIVHGKRVGYWFFYSTTGEILKDEYYPCLSKKEE